MESFFMSKPSFCRSLTADSAPVCVLKIATTELLWVIMFAPSFLFSLVFYEQGHFIASQGHGYGVFTPLSATAGGESVFVAKL
jgi:hypothetical protein